MGDLLLRRWSTLTLAAVCFLLATLGYVLGRNASSLAQVKPSSISEPSATSARSKSGVEGKVGAGENGESPLWSERWQSSWKRGSSPARTRELTALIEELAKTDAQRALALAREGADWRLRDLLRNAALRGWASVAPQLAGDWALQLRLEDRRSAMEAVLQGAAKNPPAAVELALRVCQADPEPAGDYGHYTIAALVEAGAFREAVRFGGEVGVERFPFLVKSAYFQWGRNQPDQAYQALQTIADPVLRSKVQAEVISAWAWADAQGLAAHALSLPAGDARSEALAEALPRWVEKDPVAAAEWINRFDVGKDFDPGIAAMANMQTLITRQPATALGLAGNISDGATRAHTLRAVFRQWATNDLAAARQYIASTTNPADRELLTNELKDMSPDATP